MQIFMTITGADLVAEDLHDVTRDIQHAIERETDAAVAIHEGNGSAGDKGEPITAGVILITILTSETAVALINVLKAYFDRHRKLRVALEKDDGNKLVIEADNLEDDEIEQTMKISREFFDLPE